MAVADDSLSMVLANDLAEVPRLAARVEEFCRSGHVPSRIVGRFNLALEEALTNVISYAFSDGARHEIEVRIERHGSHLSASISDDGKPFDPLSLPAPDLHAPLADRKVGGLGIHLLRLMMQSVEYRRIGGRNVLTFRTPAEP
jgi:anti-sigma regulatory factor (Ser/Thr protein kinase)